MSHIRVFAVRDQKADAFLMPIFTTTRGQAERSFTDAINDPQHQFHQHPEDYSLHEIGEYDQNTATLYPRQQGPECLCLGLTVLNAKSLELIP